MIPPQFAQNGPSSLSTAFRRLTALQADLRLARLTAAQQRKAVREGEKRLEVLLDARKVCQEAAERVQRDATSQLAGLVDRCLKAVFGNEALGFRIDITQKRGKTEAVLCFVDKDGEVLDDPVSEVGFGMLDVAAFALRLGNLLLSVPRKRKLLLLDEPTRHLSVKYRPAMARLLEALASELGVQIVLVTHAQEMAVGTVIELS